MNGIVCLLLSVVIGLATCKEIMRFMSSLNITSKGLISKYRKRLYVLIVACTLVPLGIVFHSDAVNAFTLASTHLPETYTELYFNKPANLPKYARARVVQNISFSVVNHEAKTDTYNYSASITENGRTNILSRGSVQLIPGQAAVLPLSFEILTPNIPTTIDVSLSKPYEQIVFRSHS